MTSEPIPIVVDIHVEIVPGARVTWGELRSVLGYCTPDNGHLEVSSDQGPYAIKGRAMQGTITVSGPGTKQVPAKELEVGDIIVTEVGNLPIVAISPITDVVMGNVTRLRLSAPSNSGVVSEVPIEHLVTIQVVR